MNTEQIPYEVATAMLADPTAKQSNAFRKRLRAARSTFSHVGQKPLDPDAKLVRKLTRLPLTVLGRTMRRAIRRRRAVQQAWEKTPVGWKRTREMLELKAQAFDTLFDGCHAEVVRRMAIVEKSFQEDDFASAFGKL